MKVNLRGVILLRPNVHNVVTLPVFVIYQCIYSKYSQGHFISSPVTIQFLIIIFFKPIYKCIDISVMVEVGACTHTHTNDKYKVDF